ncbi:MAG TPA: OsmC family protein [Caulobacteraceae bacterium]|nr:OsmC family protein [Caulobacteraceae bacterium]
MSEHRAGVSWKLAEGGEAFLAGRYSRAHTLRFGDGLQVPGTPSPSVVPAPWSRTAAVDPEAAFTAALSACHMLWFLDLAKQAGFVAASYEDDAAGTLARVGRGRMAMTRVVLRPRIAFAGDRIPAPAELADLHHRAHELCFIANSVTTEVVVETPET